MAKRNELRAAVRQTLLDHGLKPGHARGLGIVGEVYEGVAALESADELWAKRIAPWARYTGPLPRLALTRALRALVAP